ncbi:HAD family hydrolase [Mesomycoplasma hyorhinis]|uniref:HAD family hydrolase n=1 Tax=Mesomycoplasma hyorhinis TaxID=2100 RepID=UPI00280B8D01|nr:HAD family hydrolase [Mesomycoplasma hyorhinis]
MEKTPIMDKKEKKISFQNIVFDLDGTLLDKDKNILNSTLSILNQLHQQANKKLIIATGRPWYFTKRYINQVKPDLPIISCNGSLIYDFKAKKVIFINPIESKIAKFVFDVLKKEEITFLIYSDRQIYAFSKNKEKKDWFIWLEKTQKALEKEEQFDIDFFDTANSDFDINKLKVVKFLMIKSDSNLKNIENAVEQFKNLDKIYLLSSSPKVIDIMPVGSSKGDGLKILAKDFNLELNATISFGDEANDVSMFEVCKYSVAMGQADHYVREKASFSIENHNSDAIFNFLKDKI